MAYIYDIADTWAASGTVFTGIKLNVTDTASAAGSLLMDLQVGGVSQFKLSKTGTVTTAALFAPTIYVAGVIGGDGMWWNAGTLNITGTSRLRIGLDVALFRDAANTLAQRNGVNAQAFNLYNTYTDASNYERGVVHFTGNTFWFRTQAAGTGASRDIGLSTAGSIYIDANNGTYFRSSGGTLYGQITNDGLSMTGRFLQMTEQTAPAAPAANNVRIYAEDDGAGKTRLMARFATGAAVQIAIEP